MEKQELLSAGPWLLPLLKSDSGELLRVTQHVPDGLARGRYRGRQGGVVILKKSHDLHQQQLEFLSQLAERHPRAAVVKRFELRQQVIDLILQRELGEQADGASIDRKSTRLNSSHLVISYAVFCLTKKKQYRHFQALDFRITNVRIYAGHAVADCPAMKSDET